MFFYEKTLAFVLKMCYNNQAYQRQIKLYKEDKKVEKKKSHIGFNVLVVLLILIILASLGAGLYAWANIKHQ